MAELKEKIEREKLADWFRLSGFRKDIPELLSQSHCMIMPSLWEGMPISILEAGAAGLPIISTPVGSIPSLLNSENAYLSDLQNFHLIVEEVIQSYEKAVAKSEILRLLIKSEFDITSSAKKHHQVYSGLLFDSY